MRTFLTPSAIAVKTILLSTITSSAMLVSGHALADEALNTIENIEVITITNQRHHGVDSSDSYAQGKTSTPDLASWLATVPGANINSNGPITGIAQYRGLYGDRVSANLDGHILIGAGPNAMDTPLSYSTPLIVESMSVYRGIAPVSAGINTLGGAIEVKMRKAEINNTDTRQITGDVQAGYRSNNSANTFSGVVNITQGDMGVMVYGNQQKGDSMESGNDTLIFPTDFNKTQAGTDIRYSKDDNEVGLSYHYTDTKDSGTPALPMDIEYIESHRLNIDGKFVLSGWQGEWLVGYLDADHGMTNFLMRMNADMDKYRRNTALADTTDFKIELSKTFSFGELAFGIDGYSAIHDSVITNPNNGMFAVVNFNNVLDRRYGMFAEWQNQFADTTVNFGVRVKRAEADADEVSTSMAIMAMSDMNSDMDSNMGMGSDMNMNSDMTTMAELASNLMNDFNNANRKVDDTNIDIAFSTNTQLSQQASLYFGVGIKNRAPSYQERYLWTPMEATGGLADGHTYIGNINLKSETAYQADIGINYQSKIFTFAPHIFYQAIDNYIQGTPLPMSAMSAKMMAAMMAGDDSPLQFNNVDAKLYGADVNFAYALTDALTFSGIVSYVKGERTDINDNLYRIAPLNGQVSVSYALENIVTNLTLVAAAAQNDVSVTNQEQKTSGYGVVNIDASYFIGNNLTLRAGVDNLLDREYQNHLGGYNRVKDTDIPVMSRLPSEGVSAWAEVTYSF